MYELHCQTINRKVKAIVLNGSVGQVLTWCNVKCIRFPCIPEFSAVFKSNEKWKKNEDFFDGQYISYTDDFKSFMLFSYLLHCAVVISKT